MVNSTKAGCHIHLKRVGVRGLPEVVSGGLKGEGDGREKDGARRQESPPSRPLDDIP
jgi:hypothetical protein